MHFTTHTHCYRVVDGHSLNLTLYVPQGPGPHPAILDMHGGAWVHFDHRVDFYWCEQFARRGYVVASCDFRGGTEARWPAPYEDLQHALRWLTTEGLAYGVDPTRIATIGGSTGGHLAMTLAMAPRGVGLEIDIPVHTVIAFYPIVDVLDRYRYVQDYLFTPATRQMARWLRRAADRGTQLQPVGIGSGGPAPRLRRLAQLRSQHPTLGDLLGSAAHRSITALSRLDLPRAFLYPDLRAAHHATFESESQMQQASPSYIVARNLQRHLPRILAFVPLHDTNVRPGQAQVFAQNYRRSGGEIELIELGDVGHGFGAIPSREVDACIDRADRLMRSH